jgi:hypothetical protein
MAVLTKTSLHYADWAKQVRRPTNLRWIRRNSVKKRRMRKIERILNGKTAE